ncbi:MAG TPA: tripartite tricarboxylate transporter substrate-binding protein [Burkholderiales bacterium]|nr:tripartite tricarboxylate transporter substrate-binding protein [Burkholderiales bacterium]
MTGSVAAMPDVIARHLSQRLSERWGQGVVVENRPQVTITSGVAAKATPDGYTLLLADRTSHVVAPNLHKDLLYDPIRDFAPITLVARAPLLLVAHPSVSAANLRELIAYAKQRPGSIDYASAGPGTAVHITTERFKQVAGIDLMNVQYKGGGAAMAAILSGEAKVGFALVPVALPHVKVGKVKTYAITSAKRFTGAPDVPTMAEAGLPGFDSEELWVGMFAPVRTPRSLVAKLNADIVDILKAPATRDALRALGAEPATSTPEEFAAFIAAETATLKKVIQLAGIRVE